MAKKPPGTLDMFGIFSPVLGEREDIPHILLPDSYTSDSLNIRLRDGEIHRDRMRLHEFYNFTQSAYGAGTTYITGDHVLYGGTIWESLQDANTGETVEEGAWWTADDTLKSIPVLDDGEILHLHWYEKKATGVRTLLAFTTDNLYKWDSATNNWDLVHAFSTCTEWSVVTYKDYVVMTNNVDKIHYWDGTTCAELDSAAGVVCTAGTLTKAKFVFVFENYLGAGNLVIGGTSYYHRIAWSSLGADAADSWNSGDAGTLDIGHENQLMGRGVLGDFLILFKENTTWRIWLTASDLVFHSAQVSANFGTYAPGSVVSGPRGELYCLSSDFKIRVFESVVAEPRIVSTPVDKTLRQIPREYAGKIRSAYIPEYDHVVWAFPYGAGKTTNDRLLWFDGFRFGERDVPVSAFGVHERLSGIDAYTWNTLPFDTWEEIPWDNWGDAKISPEYEIDICGTYDGYVYALHESGTDLGTAFTAHATFNTDLTRKRGSLGFYKRISYIQVYFRRESAGSAALSLRFDNEKAWTSVGSVDLTNSDEDEIVIVEFPVDYRAKTIEVKISGTTFFRFLGILFEFQLFGQR